MKSKNIKIKSQIVSQFSHIPARRKTSLANSED